MFKEYAFMEADMQTLSILCAGKDSGKKRCLVSVRHSHLPQTMEGM